jgi:hypothetical protein
MIKPHNLEIGLWKENVLRKPTKRVKPMSAMLIEKYQQQLEEDRKYRVTQGIKRDRFFEAQNWPDQLGPWHIGEPRRRTVQHSIDQEPGIRQGPQFLIGQVWVTRITVLTVQLCCTTKEDCHKGQNRLRSMS